jgi:hypothetical protein
LQWCSTPRVSLHFCEWFHAKPDYQTTQPTTLNTVIEVIDFGWRHFKQKVRSASVVQQKLQRIDREKTALPHHTQYGLERTVRRVCYWIETNNNYLFSSTSLCLPLYFFIHSSTYASLHNSVINFLRINILSGKSKMHRPMVFMGFSYGITEITFVAPDLSNLAHRLFYDSFSLVLRV